MEWNNLIEQNIKTIGHTSMGYKEMHRIVSSDVTRVYNIITVFAILIGSVTSTLSMIQTLLYPEQDVVLPIIITCTGVITSIISGVIKFAKFEEVTTANKQAYIKYSNLENNIRRQLSIDRDSRINPTKYLEWVETKFEDIIKSAPLLPNSAYNEYEIIAEKNNLPIPDQYNSIILINDIVEYSDSIESCKTKQLDENDKECDEKGCGDKGGDDKDDENKNALQIVRTKEASLELNTMLKYEMERLRNN